MLNLLLGWFGTQKIESIFNSFVEQNVNIPYSIKASISSTDNSGLASYSYLKNALNYSNNEYIVSFVGHLYWDNFSDLSHSPEQQAEQIFNQYKIHGTRFLDDLKGHFTLIIINKSDNSCLLANDSMATIPIFYTLTNDAQLFFSNRLDLLTQSPSVEKKLNLQSIYNYIYFHMIPSPATIYENIFKLEPGQFLLFKAGQLTIKDYYLPSFIENNQVSKEGFAQKIKATLDKSVSFYSNKFNNIGSFLSGGLDSSAVSGMLAKNLDDKADTFSIGFPVEQYNEIEYARLAVQKFDTNQHEYFIQPEDVHNVVNKIIQFMDEPFGNSSVVPTYYCALLAKKSGINTLLAGDGGDELFAGNKRYAKQQLFERYFLLPGIFRKYILEPLTKNKIITSNSFGHKVKRYIDQANIKLPERLESYNFLHLHKPTDVFTQNFVSQIKPQQPIELLNNVYSKPDNASTLNRMLYLDWKHTLADNDLRKVNMMCELAGVNVEYPMLSGEMINLSCEIPSKLKLTSKKLRYLYKQAMKNFLPEKIINKPKQGFGLPFGVWTKTDKQLQNLSYDAIDYLRTLGIFNNEFLDEAIEKHQKEHAEFYGELIWILMILGLWLKAHA